MKNTTKLRPGSTKIRSECRSGSIQGPRPFVDMKLMLKTVGGCWLRAVAFGLEVRSLSHSAVYISAEPVLLLSVRHSLTIHDEHFSRRNEGPNSCLASFCWLFLGVSFSRKEARRRIQGHSKCADRRRPEAFQVYGDSGNAAKQFQARYRRLWPLQRPKVGGKRRLARYYAARS